MLPPQDEMCNMYMMTYSELPVFMTCGNGQSWYQVDGPGGIPPGSSMAPESPAVWQPPPPVAAGAGDALALGQIAGMTAVELLAYRERPTRLCDEYQRIRSTSPCRIRRPDPRPDPCARHGC